MTTGLSTSVGRTLMLVCPVDRLEPDLGSAAIFDGLQVALFRLQDGSVHAVQNLDPFSGAQVMSRGITGSRGGEPTVASPVYKQVFSLLTGECLATMDKEPRAGFVPRLVVYPVTIHNGQVFISLAGAQ